MSQLFIWPRGDDALMENGVSSFSRLFQQSLLLMISPLRSMRLLKASALRPPLTHSLTAENVFYNGCLWSFKNLWHAFLLSFIEWYKFFDYFPLKKKTQIRHCHNEWPIEINWHWLLLIMFSPWNLQTLLCLTFQSHGCQLKSHQPRSVSTLKEKCIRSHVWCLLLCLGGRVGEDNTPLHVETTVVSCQQSSLPSLETNFLLVSWREVLGFGGTTGH